MREAQIQAILQNLTASSGEIEASALVSKDGLIIASALAPGMDEARVAAIVAAMLSLGDRIAGELSRGTLEQILVSASGGHVLIQHVGQSAVLCTITSKSITLGLMFMNANHYAKAMATLLA
ncbi:roadblock/LC7 domain-containing protein [Acidocella sp.]|uniref:roadblock/LC7 domain-containing protein n=1 Tax=Acidocella sp. TaxID=50710 RepID=UPI00261B6D24|nr:roadblock/LC7 domain-containing protein [Acidocella sp.]